MAERTERIINSGSGVCSGNPPILREPEQYTVNFLANTAEPIILCDYLNPDRKKCEIGEERCVFFHTIPKEKDDNPLLTCFLPEDQKITLNSDKHELVSSLRADEDSTVYLTPTEFALLRFFMKHQGNTLTRQRIFRNVWEQDAIGDLRTINMHINRLRKKIGGGLDAAIENIKGQGYRLRTKDEKLKKPKS